MSEITVKDFIEVHKGNIGVLDVKGYIPINIKRTAVDAMIEKIIETEGLITTYDSVEKYLVFTLGAISIYTNLKTIAPEDYDTLAESGLLKPILDEMNRQGDYADFRDIFEMRFKDHMRNKNTLLGLVNDLGKTFSDLTPEDLKNFIGMLEQMVE